MIHTQSNAYFFVVEHLYSLCAKKNTLLSVAILSLLIVFVRYMVLSVHCDNSYFYVETIYFNPPFGSLSFGPKLPICTRKRTEQARV